MTCKVSLVETVDNKKNLKEYISQALKLIDFNFTENINTLAIKPNLCYYWNAQTGYTTDPKLVAGLIDYFRELFGSNIEIKVAEADASAMRTRYAFPILGYEKLAAEKGIELVNLSKDVIEEKEVVVKGRKISFKVPQTILKADLFVNVPKLKVMRATHITCALKNIFGCIAFERKIVYHSFLEEAIVGINKILHPHLTLVDGLVALGRFPAKLGLIMAGEDPFSIDWVAAQIMGHNPYKIKFLKVAIHEKLGNPKDVVICGDKIDTFSKDFPKENNTFFRLKWDLQFGLLKAYKKVVGDIVPPVLEDI